MALLSTILTACLVIAAGYFIFKLLIRLWAIYLVVSPAVKMFRQAQKSQTNNFRANNKAAQPNSQQAQSKDTNTDLSETLAQCDVCDNYVLQSQISMLDNKSTCDYCRGKV